ncbi:MAG: hypothetical protein JSS10_06605 [Verrucomicrobia bacterium]|nr:hypothetical protein [Verrucomicrobiota bacterium]
MTMSNQMALSAASVAVLANNGTLENMGSMQESFFLLDGGTIKAGLEATSLQASADEKSIMDQASAQQTQAIGALVGSGMGIATTGLGLYQGLTNYNQAAALDSPNSTLEAGVSEVPNTAKTSTPPAAPAPEASASAPSSPVAKMTCEASGEPSDPAESIARIRGELKTSVNTQENSDLNAQDAIATAETKKAQNPETVENPEAKKFRAMGDMWMQNGNTFGGLFSGVGKSAGEMASYDAMTDQAKQTKTKDLEAGLAQALNSQAGLISSQLSNLDQTRGNTYQLMSTLQHIQG